MLQRRGATAVTIVAYTIRYVRLLALVMTLFVLASAGVSNVEAFPTCETGIKAARDGRHDQAVKLLSACLAVPGVSKEERADALEARAWSYANLKQAALAVHDQQASYALRPPTEYRQYINYASYLRSAGNAQDSLSALLAAEAMENGKISMMTQYNKGWSLLELGRYQEAVEAFTKGLPIQPDYPFVYWRRGLAYERLGDSKHAQADFAMSAKLLLEKNSVAAAGDMLPAMRDKLRQYGLDKQFPL